jgi:hypothetical protein
MLGKRTGGMPSPSGRATSALSRLERPFPLIFDEPTSFNLKTTMYTISGDFIEATVAEIKKHIKRESTGRGCQANEKS